MNIPMNPLLGAAAVVPVLFLLMVMIKFGWGVAKAAPAGMILAGIIAAVGYRSSPGALFLEAGKGVWNALTILLVIWPAVFSYELSCQSQGFQAIRQGIQSLTGHELLQILILGWIFPSFLQGITGFGVAVAVGAPLLLSIGVKPFYSIVIVLLCHSWGATFGTLALAWEALISQAGIGGTLAAETAVLAAAMIWLYQLGAVLFSCWLYGGAKALKEAGPIIAFFTLILGGGQLALAPINATISNFLPSAMALGTAFLISKSKRYQGQWQLSDSKIMKRQKTGEKAVVKMSFHQAFLPYYCLTGITIVCLLIPPVNQLLSKWVFAFAFPETVTGFGYLTPAEPFFSPLKPLTYAGTFLALAAGISCFYYHRKHYLASGDLLQVWHRTIRKCLPSTIAITCFIIMSKFMSSSGQIYVLSQGIVNLLGRFYVILAPLLGIMGTFITSSNMSSNILLGKFQLTAAEILSLSPAVTLALQTVGGVLGTSFSPGCVIMGISTTGYQDGEGKILKTIILFAVAWALVFGLLAWVLLN